MESILDILGLTGNQATILTCLVIAVFRIYLEVIGHDLCALPISKMVGERVGIERMQNFHRTGLYLSIGYVILFAPEILFS